MQIIYELAPSVCPAMVVRLIGKAATPKERWRILHLLELAAASPPPDERTLARELFGKSRTENHPPFRRLVEGVSMAVLQVYSYGLRPPAKPRNREEQLRRAELLMGLLRFAPRGNQVKYHPWWKRLLRWSTTAQHLQAELLAVRRLLSYYSYANLDGEQVDRLTLRQNQLDAALSAEWRSRRAASRMRRYAVSAGSQLPELDLDQLRNDLHDFPYYTIQYKAAEALCQWYLMTGDYGAAGPIALTAQGFFVESWPNEVTPRLHFGYLFMLSCIGSKEYTKGREQLLMLWKGTSLPVAASIKILEGFLILVLRTGNTKDVALITKYFQAAQGISSVRPFAGRWWVYFSLLELLLEEGTDIAYQVANQREQLRASASRAGEVSETDRVHLIICSVYRELVAGHVRRACRQATALEQYSRARLPASDPDYRRQIFLRALLSAAKAKFHWAAGPRNADRHLKILRRGTPDLSDHSIETELIPFTVLWERIAEQLVRSLRA